MATETLNIPQTGQTQYGPWKLRLNPRKKGNRQDATKSRRFCVGDRVLVRDNGLPPDHFAVVILVNVCVSASTPGGFAARWESEPAEYRKDKGGPWGGDNIILDANIVGFADPQPNHSGLIGPWNLPAAEHRKYMLHRHRVEGDPFGETVRNPLDGATVPI